MITTNKNHNHHQQHQQISSCLSNSGEELEQFTTPNKYHVRGFQCMQEEEFAIVTRHQAEEQSKTTYKYEQHEPEEIEYVRHRDRNNSNRLDYRQGAEGSQQSEHSNHEDDGDVAGQTEPKQHEAKILNKTFKMGKMVGMGSFSKVYIGTHLPTNEQVAIKVIDKQSLNDHSWESRHPPSQITPSHFQLEIKIMRKVRHPNIIQLYSIIETKKYIYLVLEYAQNGELFDLITQRSHLTEQECSHYLLQLLDALEYLHTLNIAHRDIKPENILLDYRGNVKLIDFDLSGVYRRGEKMQTACGSPCYACPEMLEGKGYEGVQADLWSAGVVLYAMRFGYLPFDFQEQDTQYQKQRSYNQKDKGLARMYTDIKEGRYEIPEGCSEEIRDLLRKMLEVNPERRITIQEIRAHPFCRNASHKVTPGIVPTLSEIPFEPSIHIQMSELSCRHQQKQQKSSKKMDPIPLSSLMSQIQDNRHTQHTCAYYLILQRKLRMENKTMREYFQERYNLIRRFEIMGRVKEGYDRRMLRKMEERKAEAGYFVPNNTCEDRDRKVKQIGRGITATQRKRVKSVTAGTHKNQDGSLQMKKISHNVVTSPGSYQRKKSVMSLSCSKTHKKNKNASQDHRNADVGKRRLIKMGKMGMKEMKGIRMKQDRGQRSSIKKQSNGKYNASPFQNLPREQHHKNAASINGFKLLF